MSTLKKIDGHNSFLIKFNRKPRHIRGYRSSNGQPNEPPNQEEPYECLGLDIIQMPRKLETKRCWIDGGSVKFAFHNDTAVINKYYLHSRIRFSHVHDALKDEATGIWHPFHDWKSQRHYLHYYRMPILSQFVNKDGNLIIRTRTTIITMNTKKFDAK